MELRFYVDPESSLPHIHCHGVNEQEVQEVLARPLEDRTGRDSTRVALGRTRAGRYLRVVYVPDQNRHAIFVITAYDLKGKPLAAFKRRMRRRKP